MCQRSVASRLAPVTLGLATLAVACSGPAGGSDGGAVDARGDRDGDLGWDAGVPVVIEPPPDDGGTCVAGERCDCRSALSVPAGTHLAGIDVVPSCREGDFGCTDFLDRPSHHVTLTRGVFVGRFEATSGCYARCAREGDCPPSGVVECVRCGSETRMPPRYWAQIDSATLPVAHLTHPAAAAYCAWLGGRLATSAEWEKMARGEDGGRWPWDPRPADPTTITDDEAARLGVRWLAGEVPSHVPTRSSAASVVPVGMHPMDTGPYGHLDVVGNALEWVADRVYVYDGSDETDPLGPSEPSEKWGEARVVRPGGAHPWDRAAFGPTPDRERGTPTFFDGPDRPVGTRCAFDAEPAPLAMWETSTLDTRR